MLKCWEDKVSDGAIITIGMSKYYRYSEELTFKSVSLIIIRQFIIETNLVDVSSDVSKPNKINVKIQLKRYTLLFFLHMNMG